MYRRCLTILVAGILVSGCASMRETRPAHTANEELLLSKAVDNASAQMQIEPGLAQGRDLYVDRSDFKGGYNTNYAVSRITDRLLEKGYNLVPTKSEADTIVTIRSGALSINKSERLWLGIPSVTLPVPLAGPLNTSELDLFKSTNRTGVAKFGLTFDDARTGDLKDSVGPVYGFSHYDRRKILMANWTSSDLLPSSTEERR